MRTTTVTIDRLPNQMSMLGGKDFQAVMVGSTRVGTIGKNKHGIWIGNFDRTAFAADNPFAAARMSHKVAPSMRGRRTKKDVVADIVAGQEGRYERHLHATSTLAGLIRDGHVHQRTSLWDLPMGDFADAVERAARQAKTPSEAQLNAAWGV